jgi:hypothetical protein
MVSVLDSHAQRIEAMKGILGDRSLPGELPETAVLDVARTVLPSCGAVRCEARRRTALTAVSNPGLPQSPLRPALTAGQVAGGTGRC